MLDRFLAAENVKVNDEIAGCRHILRILYKCILCRIFFFICSDVVFCVIMFFIFSVNLIKIRSRTCFPLLIYYSVGDLRKPHIGWHASGLNKSHPCNLTELIFIDNLIYFHQFMMIRSVLSITIMKRKLTEWWSRIPSMLTKWTITSHLSSLNINKRDHDIWCWKSRSRLVTGTKMWRD